MNPGLNNRLTSIKPRFKQLGAGLALFVLAACAGPLVFVPVTPLLASALSSHSSDYETRKRIIELQSRSDWQGMEQLALSQLKVNPSAEDGLILLGYSRLQLGRFTEAIEPLTLVTTIHPEEIDGWNLLGEAQRLSGRHEQALRTLAHAMTIDPSSPVSPFIIGEAYRDQGMLHRALPAYRQAVELEPGMALAWYGLGVTLKRTGQKEEAAKVLQTLQKLDAGLAAQMAKEN